MIYMINQNIVNGCGFLVDSLASKLAFLSSNPANLVNPVQDAEI